MFPTCQATFHIVPKGTKVQADGVAANCQSIKNECMFVCMFGTYVFLFLYQLSNLLRAIQIFEIAPRTGKIYISMGTGKVGPTWLKPLTGQIVFYKTYLLWSIKMKSVKVIMLRESSNKQ